MRQYKVDATINGQYFRNANRMGYPVKTESDTLPATAPYEMELDEAIAPGSAVTATIAGVPAEVLPYSFTPTAGQIALDMPRGRFKFAGVDVGKSVSVTFTPAGSIITAGKMESVGTAPVQSVNGKTGAVELDATDIPFGGGSVDDAVQDLYGTKQNVDTDLTALANISGVGFISRIASGAVAPRVLTAGVGITVTNGGGISGNPTVSVDSTVARNSGKFAPGFRWCDPSIQSSVSLSASTDYIAMVRRVIGTGMTITLPGLGAVSSGQCFIVSNQDTIDVATVVQSTGGQSIVLSSVFATSHSLPTTASTGVMFIANLTSFQWNTIIL